MNQKPEVTEYLARFGMDILTPFGEKFLLGDLGCQGWKWETACRELLCEWIRRERFPDEPSRFHTVFGVASIDEARSLKKSLEIPNASIWRVGCESAARKDMRWFEFGNTLAEKAWCIDKYWSGEATNNPIWELLLLPTVLVYEKVE